MKPPFAQPVCQAFRAFLGALATVFVSTVGADLSVGSRTGSEGATVFVPVSIANATNITAAQFDILFDPARSVSEAVFGGNALVNHSLSSRLLTNGVRRVVLYSRDNTPFNPGVLASLGFTVQPGSGGTALPIRATNVLLSASSGQSVAALVTSGGLTLAPPAPAQFGNVIKGMDDVYRIEVFGSEGRAYVIQASSDLAEWVSIRTNKVVDGLLAINDSAVTNSNRRFYRAILAAP